MSKVYVRLKPYDPQRGHVLQRYSFKGICFHASRGWYTPPKEVADYLKTIHQIYDDPHSPLAFDVCTEAEAREIDTKEFQEEQPKRPVDQANPVVPRGEPESEDSPKPARRGRPRKSKPEIESETVTETEPESEEKEE